MSYDTLLQTALAPVSAHGDIDVVALEDIDVIMGYQETEAEVNALESALSHISRTALGLEALNAYVETAQEQGGMDAMAAGAVIAGADGMLSAFGGLQVVETMPSMESFEGDGGRVTATQVANEAITDTIKKLWEKFVTLLKNAQKAVMKWFDENISMVGRLSKSAQKLAEQASKATGTPEKDKLEVKGGQYLKKGDKLGDVKVADLEAFTKQMKDIMFSKKLLDAGLTFGKELAATPTDKMNGDWAKNELVRMFRNYNGDVLVAYGMKPNAVKDKRLPKADGATVHAVELALGNAFMASVIKDNKPANVTIYGSQNPESKEKLESKALSASEAGSMADAVVALCDVILDGKNANRDAEKLDSEMEKNGNNLVKAANSNKELKGEDARRLTGLIDSIGTITRNQRMINRDLVKQASQTASAAYSFALASVKNLKEAK